MVVLVTYKNEEDPFKNKNSGEVDIAPAFGEITTACNVGQQKMGHGVCLKSSLCKVSYQQASLLQRYAL